MSLPRVGKSRRLIWFFVPSKLPRRHPPPAPARLWAAGSSPLCRKTSSPCCPSPGGRGRTPCLGSAGRLVRFWPGCVHSHRSKPQPASPHPRPAPPRIRDAKSTKHRRSIPGGGVSPMPAAADTTPSAKAWQFLDSRV